MVFDFLVFKHPQPYVGVVATSRDATSSPALRTQVAVYPPFRCVERIGMIAMVLGHDGEPGSRPL